MPKLIRNAQIIEDNWQTLHLAEGDTPDAVAVSAGRWIVPLSVWQAQPALRERADIAVWLADDDEPADLVPDLAALPFVAVNFPKFANGRGYSTAVLLRTRYNYNGQLRAIGDVLRDQFDYLTRCGFDALEPAAGKYTDAQLIAALESLQCFTEPYQKSVKHPQPLFRRQRRAA